MKLENKVVLITGGASGLGLAFTKLAHQQGAKVVISDINEDNGNNLVQELGSNSYFVQCDVAQESQCKNLVDKAVEKFGALHVVLNSAGIAHAYPTITSKGVISSEDYHTVFNINVLGTLNISKYAAKVMSGQNPFDFGERGVIVNVASLAGIEGQKGQVLYGGSKGAVIGMTLPMARDLGRYGIRVVTIAPGPIKTPMAMRMPEKIFKSLESQAALKRLGEPEEFANMVVGVVSNSYITGEIIRLDGGMRMGL